MVAWALPVWVHDSAIAIGIVAGIVGGMSLIVTKVPLVGKALIVLLKIVSWPFKTLIAAASAAIARFVQTHFEAATERTIRQVLMTPNGGSSNTDIARAVGELREQVASVNETVTTARFEFATIAEQQSRGLELVESRWERQERRLLALERIIGVESGPPTPPDGIPAAPR